MTDKPYEMPQDLQALVIVSSTRASRGVYEDLSGPIAVDWLRSQGFATPDATVIADNQVVDYFASLVEQENLPTIILLSGGTGLNSDDQTVEAVRPHLDKEVPGIMHAFWQKGLETTPAAVLSRGVAGVIGKTFVMTLPGSRGGVKDGCEVLEPIIRHICRQLEDYHDH